MRLLVSENGLLVAWRAQFCGAVPPPVIEVDTGLLGVITIIFRIQRTRVYRQRLGATTYSMSWTPMDAGSTDYNTESLTQDTMLPYN